MTVTARLTFEDLNAERNALEREVFTKPRKLCEENNASFQDFDVHRTAW